MTTYEEVLARHEEDALAQPEDRSVWQAHEDRAWLLEEVRRAADLLAENDYARFTLRGQLDALRSERAERLFARLEEAVPALARAVFGEAAREKARNAWANWTDADREAELAELRASPMPPLERLGEDWRERCAKEADAEVATGMHRQAKAYDREEEMAVALAIQETGSTIAKRIRELR